MFNRVEDNQMFFGGIERYPVCLPPCVYFLSALLQSVLDFSQVFFFPVKFLEDIQNSSANIGSRPPVDLAGTDTSEKKVFHSDGPNTVP